MTCSMCNNSVQVQGLCNRCHAKFHQMLDDLGELWRDSHMELLPGKSGGGGRSSERTIGLNVAALSFVAGSDILGILHEWEKVVRADRQLTPPAFVRKPESVGAEIVDAIAFAQTHLRWAGEQEWIREYMREVKELHAMGMAAARKFVKKARRIACPAEIADGGNCNNLLKINDDDPLDIFQCRKCESQWTTLRLIAVAMSDPTRDIWLDAEAIASWTHIQERQVYRIARREGIAKKGQLYNVKQFLAHVNQAI